MSLLLDWIALPPGEAALVAGIIFLAGLARGFTGFALSALVMSTAVLLLPPVALIPVLYWLELSASLMLGRAGWREADRRVAGVLILGSMVGTFAGLGATAVMDVELSRRIAPGLVVGLAGAQLAVLRIPGLGSGVGTALAGLLAGLANGLAAVGGLVVAPFVLARGGDPRRMRATLVVYIMGGIVTSLMSHLWWGTMTAEAMRRAAVLAPVCLMGVWLGARLFTPRWQRRYRPLCLLLLVGMAGAALLRMILAGATS